MIHSTPWFRFSTPLGQVLASFKRYLFGIGAGISIVTCHVKAKLELSQLTSRDSQTQSKATLYSLTHSPINEYYETTQRHDCPIFNPPPTNFIFCGNHFREKCARAYMWQDCITLYTFMITGMGRFRYSLKNFILNVSYSIGLSNRVFKLGYLSKPNLSCFPICTLISPDSNNCQLIFPFMNK